MQNEMARLRAELAELRAELAVQGEQVVVEEQEPSEEIKAVAEIHDHGPFAPVESLVKWDDTLTFKAPDNSFSLNIQGRMQPRYTYERQRASELDSHSSFSFRRIRIDLRGHAYTENLTYRIMPELSRTANLRDGWIDYRFSDQLRVRLGQYSVPFAWERDTSSNRHQFMEYSIANNEFQWADGRDIGLMAHGPLSERWRYGLGAFGGEGRNASVTSSTGNLYTGRLTYAALGKYPSGEALLKPVEDINLSFGTGVGYANDNAARDWHIWSPGPTQTADVLGATGDVHLQFERLSSHLIGFYRHVDPSQAASYYGTGFNSQIGWLLLPERLFASLRYSATRPNSDESQGRQRELMGGLQLYHQGHGSKFFIEAGQSRNNDGEKWRDADILRIQYQLLF